MLNATLSDDQKMCLNTERSKQSFFNWHTLINSEWDTEHPEQWCCYGYRHYVPVHTLQDHDGSEQAYPQIFETPVNAEEILKALKVVDVGFNTDMNKEQIFPNQTKPNLSIVACILNRYLFNKSKLGYPQRVLSSPKYAKKLYAAWFQKNVKGKSDAERQWKEWGSMETKVKIVEWKLSLDIGMKNWYAIN
ncbi:unnamed protein product [Caenorhabditis nigoni]